ncbi:MAG: TraR/DksA C4-type zinc finger protein [Actinomycetota bacterium]|nr:TraR/DksA C4-type zinc finger protein [Actinomycetota bacterium]
MEPERARELLASERARLEQSISVLTNPQEASDRKEPGDEGSQDLYQDEFNAGRLEDLQEQVRAVERAEARLGSGTYGLSVESGQPIPDGRLEALPTAERTIEEQERYGRG